MYNGVSISEAINALGVMLGMKISDEKKRVLEYDYKDPVLICSAAGSGKTTLVILSCMLKIMTGELTPEQILGVTFSRKARAEMQNKFKFCVSKFSTEINETPKFTTFHALFLHLLQNIKKFRVLPSIDRIKNMLYKAIINKPKYLEDYDIIEKIFNFRNGIINAGLSYDGLHNRSGNKFNASKLVSISIEYKYYHSLKFCRNYINVIRVYQNFKHKHDLLDFKDMETNVLIALNDPNQALTIKQAMSRYKICFMDEFQDINNLQWEIMNKILPEEAKEHIVAVGDDDQSIYAFRGSNPNIIMNFDENVPSTKVFHLSTNYRTGGRILDCVKPLIERNHYRLDKQIKSANPGTGKLIEFKSEYPKISDGQLLLKHLLKQCNDPSIPNSQIAVLCRYNIDKELVTDFLANHHIYIKTEQHRILQNQKDYKVYTDLMYALWKDNFAKFRHHLGKIGFSFYRSHVNKVLKHFNKSRVKKLSKYLRYADKYDTKYRLKIENNNVHAISDDNKVRSAFEHVREFNNIDKYPLAALDEAYKLVIFTYTYMRERGYSTSTNYIRMHQYLKKQLANVSSLDSFFEREQDKKYILSHSELFSDNSVNVMSIHQSKGLQFDYVYLYNLTGRTVNEDMININNLIYPNLSFEKFKQGSVRLGSKEIRSFGKKWARRYEEIIGRLIKFDNNDGDMDHYNANYMKYDLINLYHSLISLSTTVEEERRVTYVAITRAKKGLYINCNRDSSPLLKELKVNSSNIYRLNQEGENIGGTTVKAH